MRRLVVPSSLISGGSIGGLLQFQNSDLTDASTLLGQMATAITGALNQQQALGLDLNGEVEGRCSRSRRAPRLQHRAAPPLGTGTIK